MIDEIDAKIVSILQNDARVANAEIARQLGMAPSGILERIRKLESRGIIQSYEAHINPRSVQLGLLAFVFIRADERLISNETGEQLAAIPEVLEVHHITGEDCYLVKVRVADTEALGRLLREQFGSLPAVVSTRTTIVLTTLKESTALPLTHLLEDTSNDHRS